IRSISFQSLRAHDQKQRAHRVDGTRRRVWRQRSNGIVLLAPAEERPEPATLGNPRRTPPCDHHLDRTHPTTVGAGNAASANSPRSRLRQQKWLPTPPRKYKPTESSKLGADPGGHRDR